MHHDTHATPPQFIQKEHWRYQSMRKADLDTDPDIFDLSKRDQFSEDHKDIWRPAGIIPATQIEAACQAYARGKPLAIPAEDAQIFEHRDFPGLQVISGLLPLRHKSFLRHVSCTEIWQMQATRSTSRRIMISRTLRNPHRTNCDSTVAFFCVNEQHRRTV